MAFLAEGQTFGHYRVLRQLGKGLSGESYEAEDVRDQHKVTLKLLHPWSVLPNTIQRHFFREMQAISTFSHPYLAGIRDYGEYGGQIYIVRRYVSLGSLLGEEGRHWYRPPLTPACAIQLTQQIAQTLDQIHQHGYVHGSLTFANILLLNNFKQVEGEDFAPFLIADVGLAHFVRRFGQPETTFLPVTAAPEQLGQRVEPASDQYALAVVLYFWLTGQLPFRGTVEEMEYLKLSTTLPSPTKWNPQISSRQEKILRQALSVYPEERYPSILTFANELQASLRTSAMSELLQGPWEIFEQTNNKPFADNESLFEQTIPSTPVPRFMPTLPATPPVEIAEQSSTVAPEMPHKTDVVANGHSNFEQLLMALSHSALPDVEEQSEQPAPNLPQPLPAPTPQPAPIPIPQPLPQPTPLPETQPEPLIIPRPRPDIYTPLPEPMKPPASPTPAESQPAMNIEQTNEQGRVQTPLQFAYFVITSPYDQEPRTTRIERLSTTIGRASSSDILLDHDPQTSRHQAMLKHEQETYTFYDLHSAYGSVLNGQKLTSGMGYALCNGDRINIGAYELVFCLTSSAIEG